MKEEVVEERTVRHLCRMIQETLLAESNLQTVTSPVTLVGDVHGQFYDVLKLISIGISSLI